MISIDHLEDNIIVITVSSTLTKEDYETLTPRLEQEAARYETVRLVWEMQNFRGWQPGALLEDAKLDAQLNRKVTKLAMVGEARWQSWMTQLTKPFASGEVRYFDETERGAAYGWIRSGTM